MYAHNFFPSEFKERLKDGLLFTISQSGETGDVVGVIERARKVEKGVPVVALLNVVYSSIGRMANRVIPTHAQKEIGVAATKSYINQIALLLRLAAAMAGKRGKALLPHLSEDKVVGAIEEALRHEEEVREVAEWIDGEWEENSSITVLGIKPFHYIAEEVKLKIQEVGHVPAEAMPLGEVRHGPLAIADKGTFYIVFAPVESPLRSGEENKAAFNAFKSYIEQLKAKKGKVVLVGLQENLEEGVLKKVDRAIVLEGVEGELPALFAYAIIGQLLAYYLSVRRGHNPDKPDNLAKSVTVV